MRIVGRDEAMKWVSQKGLVSEDGTVVLPNAQARAAFRIPPDSGKKTALSLALASLVTGGDESLLWILEHGIWPSCEDPFLFDGFRKSIAACGPVSEHPAHLYGRDDAQTVQSLLALILYFVWGAVIVSPEQGVLVDISHDEIIEIEALSDSQMARIKARLGQIAEPLE